MLGKTVLVSALVVALAAGAAATTASAQAAGPFGPGPRQIGRIARQGGPGLRADLPLGALDLSDTQRKDIRAIMARHREEFRMLAEQTANGRRALQELVAAEDSTEEAIRAQSAAVARLEADVAVLRAAVHKEVFQSLTPDQQSKVRQLRAQRQQRLDERRQRMERRRQPRQQG